MIRQSLWGVLFLLAVNPIGAAEKSVEKSEKPNIVFIYTDDQSFNTIAALGHPIVKTPNLDRLVHEGTSFTNTYNQGGWHGAVCVASRSMLNSGRFIWHIQKKLEPDLHPVKAAEAKADVLAQLESEFWSRLLKNGGYTTYFAGKWHVGVPPKRVFDHTALVRGGMPSTVESSYNRPFEDAEDVWSPFDPQFRGHWYNGQNDDHQHWAESLADQSIKYLEDAAEREEPFFMYLAFNSPHDPRQAPKEYVDMYPHEKMDVPDNFLPENPYKDMMGCPSNLRDERLAPFPRTEYAVRVHRREYYAIISHLDTQVGRILDAVKKSGKSDKTYIFFAADNGLAIGAHGLFGKQNMFEHSVKVPLMVVGPNIPKNHRIDTPVYLQDIVPTSLELAEQKIPEYVQFKSLLPLIRGEKKKQYDAIYGAFRHLQRMVRKDDYKLIVYPEGNIRLLFDLKNDPDEKNNLADKPEYAAKIQELHRELLRLQKETGDALKLQ